MQQSFTILKPAQKMLLSKNRKQKGENEIDNNEDEGHDGAMENVMDRNLFTIDINRKFLKICNNCETTESKMWRQGRESNQTLCNACGLYENSHGGKSRPLKL
eukprot:Pgem_evm1s12605